MNEIETARYLKNLTEENKALKKQIEIKNKTIEEMHYLILELKEKEVSEWNTLKIKNH